MAVSMVPNLSTILMSNLSYFIRKSKKRPCFCLQCIFRINLEQVINGQEHHFPDGTIAKMSEVGNIDITFTEPRFLKEVIVKVSLAQVEQ